MPYPSLFFQNFGTDVIILHKEIIFFTTKGCDISMKGSQEGQHRKNVFFCNFCIVQEYLGKIVSLQIHIKKKRRERAWDKRQMEF